MAKVKKIGLLSFTKLQTLMGTIIGLIAGILYSFGGFFIDTFVSLGWVSAEFAETPGLSYGTILAFGALIGMPIIFAGFGLILGFIEAILYNLYAKWFGGIEINLE